MIEFLRKNRKTIIKISFSLSLILLIIFTISFYIKKFEIVEKTIKIAEDNMQTSIHIIEQKLLKLEIICNAILKKLSKRSTDRKEIEETIIKFAEENPYVFGIGIAFKPYGYNKKKSLYAPYYKKDQNNKFKLYHVENLYNYADGSHDWFELPLKKGAMWQEPYYGEASKAFLAEYTAPLYRNNEAIAVVFVNYSLDDIKEHMALSGKGKTGYSCIISKTGRSIYHPNNDLMRSQKTIFEISKENNNKKLETAAIEAVQGKSGIVDKYISPISNLKGWLLYKPIRHTGWSLFTIIARNDARLDNELVIKRGTELSLLLVITSIFFFFLVFRRNWLRISCITFALLWGIGSTWFLITKSNGAIQNEISDELAIHKFKKIFSAESKKRYLKEPVYIPTGLFIQSMEFKGSHNVELTGYLWQEYANGIDINRGFILPEATDITVEKAYSKKYNNREVTGWYFQATLRERFDYSKYPLDKEDLWLRIWHKDFFDNVILVPDLKSYSFINPESLPGLEKDFVTPGMKIIRSYFNYRMYSYNTDFGIRSFVVEEDLPELTFNITLRRNILNAFISHLIPLIIVISLLYFILLLKLGEKDHVLNVLAACSALFFVTIFDHIGLRNSLSSSAIVYLEYFYFIVYFAILGVSVNSYAFAFHNNVNVIQYKDNLYPRIFYWPFILSMLYIVTLFVYY